jgi:tetratricopeptide (TPR) repeat protein
MLRTRMVLFLLLVIANGHAQQKKDSRGHAIDYFTLGERAIEDKSYRTALAHFNECLRLDPYYWDAYFLRAFSKDKCGDPKGALTDYNIFLESKPGDTDALFSRAILRFNNGQWATAKADFIKLLSIPKTETTILFFQTNRVGQAEKVLTTQGNLTALYFNYLGLIEWKMLNYPEAILRLDSAIKIDSTTPDYWLNRGLVRQSSRDTLGARMDYQKVLLLDADNPLAAHNLTVLSGFKGDLNESERQLTEAIRKNATLSYPHSERGYVRLKLARWKDALADFNSAILIEKDDPDNYFNRGIVKEKLKDFTGALADFTHATTLKPDFERAWLNKGNALVKLNRIKEAIEDYTIAISFFDNYGIAYYNRALAYHKAGNLKEACLDLLNAQRLNMKIETKVIQSICK